MDSARLGRVLGKGARGAAKTLIAAVDAASAPNPRAVAPAHAPVSPGVSDSPFSPTSRNLPKTPQPSPTKSDSAHHSASAAPAGNPHRYTEQNQPAISSPRQHADSTTTRTVPVGFAEGSRRFRSAVSQPVRRLSGVLWLEFTGVFFGLFALSAGLGAWRLYNSAHVPGAEPVARNHFLFAAGIAVVFAYFCISSFARASRRSKQA